MKNHIPYVNACADAAWAILTHVPSDPMNNGPDVEAAVKQTIRMLVAIDHEQETGGHVDFEALGRFVGRGNQQITTSMAHIMAAWPQLAPMVYDRADDWMISEHAPERPLPNPYLAPHGSFFGTSGRAS